MIFNVIVMALAMAFQSSLSTAAFNIIMWTCIILEFIGMYILFEVAKMLIKDAVG